MIVYDPIEVLEQNPASVVFARHAEKLADEGNIPEAVAVLEKGTRANPFYATGHTVFAGILLIQGDEKRALQELYTSLALDPQQPAALVQFGKYFAESSPREAYEFLNTALRYAPELTDIRELVSSLSIDIEPEMDLQLSDSTEQALRNVSEETQVIDESASLDIEESLLSEEDALIALMGEDVPEDAGIDTAEAETLISDEPESAPSEETVAESGAFDEPDDSGIDMQLDNFEVGETLLDEIGDSGEIEDSLEMDEAFGIASEDDSSEKTLVEEDVAEWNISESVEPEVSEDASSEEESDDIDAMSIDSTENDEPQLVAEDDALLTDVADESEDETDIRESIESADAGSGELTEFPEASEDIESEAQENEKSMAGVEPEQESDVSPNVTAKTEVPAAQNSEDITEEFLAYAQMIEAESVSEDSPTYDKLISGDFTGGGDTDTSSVASSTPFDLDDEWLHAISSSDASATGEEQERSDTDAMNRELMDYVRLFEESTESDIAPELAKETPIIDIDDTTEYNPSQFNLDSESILSDEERKFLEGDSFSIPEPTKSTVDVNDGVELELQETERQEPRDESDESYDMGDDLESIIGSLSHEELEELSQSGSEEATDRDLKNDTAEGIDYGADQGRDFDDEHEEEGVLLEFGVTDKTSEDVASNQPMGAPSDFGGDISVSENLSEGESAEASHIVEDIVSDLDTTPVADDLGVDADIDSLTIDDLLDEYVSTLKNESSVPLASDYPEGDPSIGDEDVAQSAPPENEDMRTETDADDSRLDIVDEDFAGTLASITGHTDLHDSAPTSHRTSEHEEEDEDVTATIAEIYVAQGFIQKAITVYRKLSERDPDNEAIRSRLTGLQQQYDRQSDKS